MKIAKNTTSKLTITPENIGGSCMSGKGMSKAELVQITEWVKKKKSSTKLKS